MLFNLQLDVSFFKLRERNSIFGVLGLSLKMKLDSVRRRWLSRVAEIARREYEVLKGEVEPLLEEIASKIASIGGKFDIDPSGYEITFRVEKPVPANVTYIAELGGFDRYDWIIECIGYTKEQCKQFEDDLEKEFWEKIDDATLDLLEKLEENADTVSEYLTLKGLIEFIEGELENVGS